MMSDFLKTDWKKHAVLANVGLNHHLKAEIRLRPMHERGEKFPVYFVAIY